MAETSSVGSSKSARGSKGLGGPLTQDLVVRKAAAGGWAALIAGLVAAVAARLAMSLLASLNADVAGAISDDGFVIGQVTFGGTAQLTGACLQLTSIGAAFYLLLRPFLVGTGAVRVVTSAVGFGVPVAAVAIIHPGGVDFTRLEPRWLAIALFVALPVGVVAIFAALAEHWLRDESWFMSASRSRVSPLLATWIAAGIGLVLLVPIFVAAWVSAGASTRDPSEPALPAKAKRLGQGVLVTIAALGTWALVDDVATILG
ncbi:hypothetical protein [Nocardioides sp. HB32]